MTPAARNTRHAPPDAVRRERAPTNYGNRRSLARLAVVIGKSARLEERSVPGPRPTAPRLPAWLPQTGATLRPEPDDNGKSLTLRGKSNPQER